MMPQAIRVVDPEELAFEQYLDDPFALDEGNFHDPAWLDEWYICAFAGMDLESCQIVDPERFAAHERDHLAYTQAVA